MFEAKVGEVRALDVLDLASPVVISPPQAAVGWSVGLWDGHPLRSREVSFMCGSRG